MPLPQYYMSIICVRVTNLTGVPWYYIDGNVDTPPATAYHCAVQEYYCVSKYCFLLGGASLGERLRKIVSFEFKVVIAVDLGEEADGALPSQRALEIDTRKIGANLAEDMTRRTGAV